MGFSRSTAGSSNPRLLRHLGCRHPIPLIPTHSRRRGDLSWSIGFHRSPIRQFPSWLTSGKGTVDSRLEVLPRGEKFPGRIAPSASSALSRLFNPIFPTPLLLPVYRRRQDSSRALPLCHLFPLLQEAFLGVESISRSRGRDPSSAGGRTRSGSLSRRGCSLFQGLSAPSTLSSLLAA